MYRKRTSLSVILCIGVLLACGFFFADAVFAQQNTFGTAEVQQATILGGDDIRVIVMKIIRAVLSLLGIIALGLMLYGGFIYMTSGGSEEKIGQAKKILINASIGLAIILSSFAIVQFFLSRFHEAAGGVIPERIPQCLNPVDCQEIVIRDRCADQGFVVTSLSPNTDKEKQTGMSNIAVRAIFSKQLSVNQDLIEVFAVTKDGAQDSLRIREAQFIADRYGVEMILEQDTPVCVGAGDQNGCLENGGYHIEVNEELRDASGQILQTVLQCGNPPRDVVFPRETDFSVNRDVIDRLPPVFAQPNDPIAIVPPEGVQVGRGARRSFILERGQNYTVRVEMRDRQQIEGDDAGGMAYAEYVLEQKEPRRPGSVRFADGPAVAANSVDPYTFEIPLSLPATVRTWSIHDITIHAYDIDHNVRTVSTSIVVVGEGCLANPDAEQCQPPPQCNDDLQCPSQKCLNNQCVPWPMITNVSAWDGAAQNLVTISGMNFGQEPGGIAFGYRGQWVDAPLARCEGQDVWNDQWIVVEVPADAERLPVHSTSSVRILKRAGEDDGIPFEDSTTDDHGPRSGPREGYFLKNDLRRPGLCFVETRPGEGEPAREGVAGDPVRAVGQGFGDGNQSRVLFDGQEALLGDRWTDREIFASVPFAAPSGTASVVIDVRGTESNGVPFVIHGNRDELIRPVIESVIPTSTTGDSLVTIVGSGFGEIVGTVWVADNEAAVKTCPTPATRHISCAQLTTQLPAFCGDTWRDKQVIVQVPVNLEKENYALLLTTGVSVSTDGSEHLKVIAGGPRPGICALEPDQGPAPLPVGTQLTVRGMNLGANPVVHFWKQGAALQDLQTWLRTVRVAGADDIGIHVAENSRIETDMGIDPNTRVSMPPGPGPIVVAAANNNQSNPVLYTVSDCTADPDSPPRPGYHCCIDGPEKGIWKQAVDMCEGEVRDAGYVWRFSSGRIPDFPQVLEQCDPEDLNLLPSPTPSLLWRDGAEACTNSLITIRFSQAMDAETFEDNIQVFTCGNGEQPDCRYRDNENVTAQYQIEPIGNDALQLRFAAGRAGHTPGLWYRVMLTEAIQGISQIEGLDTPDRVPLLATRPIDGRNGVAYHFDFKTGLVQCRLTSVQIHPPAFTATRLGIILDPQLGFNPLYKQFFHLLGRGNQECSVIEPGNGWTWTSRRNDVVRHTVSPPANDQQSDRRIYVTALQDDGGRVAPITAASSSLGFTATTSISVSLADPEVTAYWPNCAVACPNASIGVTFSREMFLEDFRNNEVLRLEKCSDETCVQVVHVPLQPVQPTNPFEFEQFLPDGIALATNTWYRVTVSNRLRAVGEIDPARPLLNGRQVRAGRLLRPLHPETNSYAWKFRTKAEDEFCILDRTELSPNPYLATDVGEITPYQVIPFSEPDECSPRGQRLNPWGYGWSWSTTDAVAARVASVTRTQTSSQRPLFCSPACLPLGSNVARGGSDFFCGNGRIDPGEDCEIVDANFFGIINNPGVNCSLNCLRRGNPNAGEGDTQCGNGIVEVAVGEECDDESDTCSDTCLFEGISQERPQDPSLPWCGSGTRTGSEECDIALSLDTARQKNIPLAETNVGCTQRCTHAGTSLSAKFCHIFGSQRIQGTLIKDLPECKRSYSVCGNGYVEPGEQCEVLQNKLFYLDVQGFSQSIAIQNPETHCSDRCILQNICQVPQISLKAIPNDRGLRCLGGDGCNADCTLAGSSILYQTQSVCGDAQIGVGEDAQCEISVADLARGTLGQNPLQLVTAVGNGPVDPATNAQHTQILSAPISVRERDQSVRRFDAAFQDDNEAASDYYLQCGYIEFASLSSDVMYMRDGNMEDARLGAPGQSGLWVPWWPVQGLLVEKSTSTAAIYRGRQGMHVRFTANQGNSLRGFSQENIPVIPGVYQLAYSYRLIQGDFRVSVILNNVGREIASFQNQMQADWKRVTSQVVIPENIQKVQLAVLAQTGELYIDDIQLIRVNRSEPTQTNDCPQNQSNLKGVGSNSCCYVRPVRTNTYPLPGSGLPGAPADRAAPVCRNTYIEVGFNHQMDDASVRDNILIARGYEDAQHVCAGANEQDVTADMRRLFASADTNREDGGLFQRIWNGVKTFFAGMFGRSVQAALVNIEPQNIAVWCSGAVQADPVIRHHLSDDGLQASSTVSLYIRNILDEEATYAVLLKGGLEGIRDVDGVGIRAAVLHPNGVAPLDDIFVFRTSRQICRLEDLTIDPSSYLYTVPNTAPDVAPEFFIDTISTNGQRIVSTPAYSWVWDWIPTTTPLYRIPVAPRVNVPQGQQTNIPLLKIGATDLEGNLAVAGQALVTFDVSEQDSHTGRVFSGITELRSNFCENPWPPRTVYPYQDGIPFGQVRNNDAFVNGQFTSDSLTRVAGEYFNFGVSYCADAGRTGTTTDDLPYLKPLVSHGGVCRVSRRVCHQQGDCQYVKQDPGSALVDVLGETSQWCFSPENENAAFLKLSKPGSIFFGNQTYTLRHRVSCSTDADCRSIDTYKNADGTLHIGFAAVDQNNPRILSQEEIQTLSATAGCTQPRPDTPRDQCILDNEPKTVDDAVKQTLFFNDINDDAIGIKIYNNEHRLTAAKWYEKQPFRTGNIRAITVGGYDAVTDGNSYFINFLNSEENRQIRQYILALSINADAQQNTRNVYQQLLDSFEFNINLSDFGYCMRELPREAVGDRGADDPPPPPVSPVISRDAVVQRHITAIPCNTDFDCRLPNGFPKQGTSGMCSNAKTKFKNDWQRLHDIRTAQQNLERYRARETQYPPLLGGTYIPRYTNSRWLSSWGLLGRTINGLSIDPVNRWSSCNTDDPQTCWNEQEAIFHCPVKSSVYEYEFQQENGDYTLHVPFEYFTEADDAVREFVNINRINPEPWCRNQRVSPFRSLCGDGVRNADEQCDPPGSIEVESSNADGRVRTLTCNNTCQFDVGNWERNTSCGDGRVDIARGETCDDGPLNGTYGHCAGVCSFYLDVNGNGRPDRGGGIGAVDECALGIAAQIVNNGPTPCHGRHRERCGDGVVNRPDEFCDVAEGRFVPGFCKNNPERACRVHGDCGNADQQLCTNVVSPTYDFTEGRSCSWDCKAPGGFCGDGILQLDGWETCDDGNRESGDGCANTCQQENLACKQVAQIDIIANVDETFFETYVRLRREDGNAYEVCFNRSTGNAICQAYGLSCFEIVNDPLQNRQADVTCSDRLDGQLENDEVAYVHCLGRPADVAAAQGPQPPARCGNGIEEEGEDCDLGNRNGQRCTPGYNQSCVTCAADCRTEVTVQPTAYCGNNVLDVEAETCDRLANGQISALHPENGGRIGSCTGAGEVGSLQCNNQCQLQPITETCILCNLVNNNTGALPRLTILNPMGDTDRANNRHWVEEQKFGLYRRDRRPQRRGTFQRMSAVIEAQDIRVLANYFALFNGNDRLVTNALCRAEYGVVFNGPQLSELFQEGNVAAGSEIERLVGRDPAPLGVFKYGVDGEARTIDRDVVVSPAVPEGAFRIVVRWTKAENDRGVVFPGYIYRFTNDRDESDVVSLARARERGGAGVSNEYSFDSVEGSVRHWVPDQVRFRGGIAVHPVVHAGNTYTQSFTVYADQRGENRSYSFFVGVTGADVNIPITLYQNSNVQVEVYDYHEGQNQQYSIYPPRYVFNLRAAKRSSNVNAKYWHVFNILPDGRQPPEAPYVVELIREEETTAGGETIAGEAQPDGIISTDWRKIDMQAWLTLFRSQGPVYPEEEEEI